MRGPVTRMDTGTLRLCHSPPCHLWGLLFLGCRQLRPCGNKFLWFRDDPILSETSAFLGLHPNCPSKESVNTQFSLQTLSLKHLESSPLHGGTPDSSPSGTRVFREREPQEDEDLGQHLLAWLHQSGQPQDSEGGHVLGVL